MDKPGKSRNSGAIFVDKHVENVDESAFYELYMHIRPSVYASADLAVGEVFTIPRKACLFGNISSVILK